MPQTYQQLASCAPSQHEDVYILAIAPTASRGIAAITSMDELLLLRSESLQSQDVARCQGAPLGLTSLAVVDQGMTAICAGNDNTVAVFDLRSQTSVARFKSGMCDGCTCHRT